ncbi:MAG TPA: bifunctional UDP-sugar hydrolase/5'-nucleotidase [Candidatus Sulfopaludibacter sp.]|nr:bifunctional UDP-sugar hydrolase/5'-nucleotidase [Candidatus Sulfopaludibacter sp.]
MQIRSRRLLALLLLLFLPVAAEIRSLTILHTNDLHARLTPLENHAGGFAYLAAAIRHERSGCNDCILLNAGDLVQGTPVSTIFRGTPVYEIGNLLGFDAASLGNHEFDYGWEQALEFLKIARYPVVTANVVNGAGKLFTPKPYTILNVNGLRVAVLGIMTGTLADITTPKSVGEWHTLPAVETARRYAAELKAQSDLIVALAHITPQEELQFLESAPEIPVLVTGHAHNGMERAAERDGRVLVRVKGYGQELGRLELKVDTEKKAPVEWRWKRIPIDSAAIQPDAEVAAQVKHWEGKVSAVVDQPLALSKKAFNKREVKVLIEQAMCDETGADFAWMNMGGVRDTLPQGQLLVRHIWDIMPFDNTVLVGTFKGRDMPTVVLGGRKLDPDRSYTLAVSDFTAANQQTEENLRTTGLLFSRDAGPMRDLIIDWFRKKKILGE